MSPENRKPDRRSLAEFFGFDLDDFQYRAVEIIERGESVVVAAPTGSGKTVVGEFGLRRAVEMGKRAFYTTPIKALSNQKFHDLSAMFGAERVGLLTGDSVVNPEAAIIVMTTEVLRNMIYARSSALDELCLVVLDEVHFLQDAYRGPVWEEVIIHLSHEVQLVCLSATVSNAPEVAEWMSVVRGPTSFVIEERRPVELECQVMVGEKDGSDHLLSILGASGVNPVLSRLVETVRVTRTAKRSARRVLVTPRRVDVVERLRLEDMLPTIYFVFSRQGCDEAATAVATHVRGLTTPEERLRIARIVDDRVRDMTEADLDVLDFDSFRERLESGIASHHAGMIPPFKEAVERCFAEGLIKVVFATETLAVGINMPARSVVIDKLTKFNGEHHEFLSAAQFTQLTGRAGRRGLDPKGHAVLLWSPFVSLDQMVSLALSRSFRLTSSFRPTYNMAVNLIGRYRRAEAKSLLDQSLAQFQSDRDIVRVQSRSERKKDELIELEDRLARDVDDLDGFWKFVADGDKTPDRSAEELVDALSQLRPGDIIRVSKGGYNGPAVVLATTKRSMGWKVSALSTRRSLLEISQGDFSAPPVRLARIDLPQPFMPTRQDFQKKAVELMDRSMKKQSPRSSSRPATETSDVVHPAAFHTNVPLARRITRLKKEIDLLDQKTDRKASTISRTFDRVLDILQDLGYVDNWSLTDKGSVLSHTFHECDLLIAESLHRGYLDGLEAPVLAAVTSCFVYEHRSSDTPPAPWFPNKEARARWKKIEQLSAQLRQLEISQHLIAHRAPDPTYISVVYSWAVGEDFADVVESEELSGGDFVRNMKQTIDLLRQMSEMAPSATTRREAARAADVLMRGVILSSSTVSEAIP